MKKLCLVAALLISAPVFAYSPKQLLADCQATEAPQDAENTQKAARCTAYLEGFTDGYAVGEYLADKVGVQLNAYCLPRDPELLHRVTRAVLIQLERVPPNSTLSSATLVGGALAKAFPCAEGLDPKK